MLLLLFSVAALWYFGAPLWLYVVVCSVIWAIEKSQARTQQQSEQEMHDREVKQKLDYIGSEEYYWDKVCESSRKSS